MTTLQWDKTGERLFETGVDHGVLYIPNASGVYSNGYAWNGLTAVTESPSGAESNKQYADNQVYLNLLSAEEFGGTIEAFTYPKEFGQCDGTLEVVPGVLIGQQNRKSFGFSYRTKIGNDLEGQDHGYKLHLVWDALAAPSEKAYATVNDSPEAVTFSWEFSTTPVAWSGGKPTASLTIDSTTVDATALANLEAALYGTVGTDPRLPTPDEVVAFFSGSVTLVNPVKPTFTPATNTLDIPATTGVIYSINGVDQVAGSVIIEDDVVIDLLIPNTAPETHYRITDSVRNDEVIEPGTYTLTEAAFVRAVLNQGFHWAPGLYDTDWTFTPTP